MFCLNFKKNFMSKIFICNRHNIWIGTMHDSYTRQYKNDYQRKKKERERENQLVGKKHFNNL